MLRKLAQMRSCVVHGTDGELGRVHSFLFDDLTWTVRYLVVDIGRIIRGKLVLVSPSSILNAEWDKQDVKIGLTREELKNSPGIEADKPVSRKIEIDYARTFNWPAYWQTPLAAMPGTFGLGVLPQPIANTRDYLPDVETADDGDPHLRSTAELLGNDVETTDGLLGHVDDFIADDTDWVIRYLVLDTEKWLHGRRIVVSPQWIEGIAWRDGLIITNVSRETLIRCPEYDYEAPVSRDFEDKIHEAVCRPKYWELVRTDGKK